MSSGCFHSIQPVGVCLPWLTLPQSSKPESNHYKTEDRPVMDTSPHGQCKSDYLDRVGCFNGRMDTISRRYPAREAGT